MFKKLFGMKTTKAKMQKNYHNMSLGEKLHAQQTRVKSALNVFQDTYNEVEKAQGELDILIDTGKKEIERLTQVVTSANDERQMNEKVKVKLAEIVPGLE